MPFISGVHKTVSFIAVHIGDEAGQRIGDDPQLFFALSKRGFRSFPFGNVEHDAGDLSRMPGRVGEHLPGHRNPTLTGRARAKDPALKVVGGPVFNRLGNGLLHPLSIIGMNQLLKGREGAGEAHGREAENGLKFRGEHQRLVVEVLVKCAHAAGSQRQAMPGFTLLENLHDVFLLAVGVVQASCQKPEERQHDQHHSGHSQCHAEIEVVLPRPLGCNANPSGEYRQHDGEGQETSQHHPPELLAGEGGHQAPRRSRAENSQAQCHQQEGAIDGGG